MDAAALAIPIVSFAAAGSAVLALGQFLGARPGGAARRLERYTEASRQAPDAAPAPTVDVQLLREQRYSNWAMLDQMIARRSWAERAAADLVRADLPLRVGEYLMLRWLGAAVFALIGFALVHHFLLPMLLAPIGYLLPRMWVKRCQDQRRRKFDDQLVEAISLLASTLKSGYSFLQGMEAVATEMPAPVSTEFDRLIKEIGVGARADEALLRLIDRVRSDDLELVVTAIMIQRTVGGELAGILENITKTVRERQRIKRDVSTLTAQQRWSGYIIGALPFFLMGVIYFVNPGYTDELVQTLHGRVMVGIALVLELIGFLMIKRIIAIEV